VSIVTFFGLSVSALINPVRSSFFREMASNA